MATIITVNPSNARDKPRLSALERCPPWREMKYSRDQLHVSASGVHFNEVSVKRELTLLTQVEDFVKILARFSAWEGI